MQQNSIFERSLNIGTEWEIESLDFDGDKERLTITLNVKEAAVFRCPKCECKTVEIHKEEIKQWRYFSFFEYGSSIVAPQIWIQCPEHGVQKVKAPWEESIHRAVGGSKRLKR